MRDGDVGGRLFGVRAEQLRRVTMIGAILGGLMVAVALAVGYSRSTVQTSADVARVVLWALALAAILPVAIGLAGMFRLRVEIREIQQLIGPWVVARRPARELRRVAFGGRLFPVVLHFADGSRFRLLALHAREHAALAASIHAVAPRAEIE